MLQQTDPVASEQFIRGPSGLDLLVHTWRPSAPARAVLVICHGLNSHGGQYAWVGRRMAQAGVAVYALDLRGRGRSEGERFFVAQAGDYVDDLASVIALAARDEPELPIFLIGHSVGGGVACTYVLDHQDRLAGFICESFAYRIPAPGFLLGVIKVLARIAPKLRVFKLKNADFTRDPALLAALDADPFIAGESQPAQTVAALVRADERLTREFDRVTLPVLILHGTADRATLADGSRAFHAAARSSDKTLKLYDGAVHDLLADTVRETVLADVTDWIDRRIATRR